MHKNRNDVNKTPDPDPEDELLRKDRKEVERLGIELEKEQRLTALQEERKKRAVPATPVAASKVDFIEIYFKGEKENEDRERIKEYLKNQNSAHHPI